jgi:RNA polymerase sigma factor (sigma-70 family)
MLHLTAQIRDQNEALPALSQWTAARSGPRVARCATMEGALSRPTVNDVPENEPHRGRTKEFETHRSPARKDDGVDDSALARAGLMGQSWARQEIWYRFAPMVHALLRRALGARPDQEDLLQEVFLRVFRRLDTLQNMAALRAFIYSFAIRVIREEMRRHRLRAKLAALFSGSGPELSAPEVDFESREILLRVQQTLDRMQGRKRAVFVLRRFDGMELAEIATSLGLSLATVKRDLEKANRFVARCIHRDEFLERRLSLAVKGGE